ncbi:hypothetical protein [Pseudofrankia sp. DC12]|nr:hypothetical protein [Pseudofrankia sp. DC12]
MAAALTTVAFLSGAWPLLIAAGGWALLTAGQFGLALRARRHRKNKAVS